MIRVFMLGVAVAAGSLMVLVYAGPPAQASPDVIGACGKDKAVIDASGLPSTFGTDKCPVGDRPIVDNGAGSVLPPAGEGVYAEALTTSGAEELIVNHQKDGTVELDKVGNDEQAATAPAQFTASATSNGCGDRAYNDLSFRVNSTFKYYFNRKTTPSELTRSNAEDAIRRGGNHITGVSNPCGIADRVPVAQSYLGNTRTGVDVSGDTCTKSDSKNVAAFGKLPSGTLAVTCTSYELRKGYDSVTTSDVKINKSSASWTVRPGAKTCRRKFDLESVITHERGHTFGLGHVSESKHGELTMSPLIEGTCEASERSLGKGDAQGLNHKY